MLVSTVDGDSRCLTGRVAADPKSFSHQATAVGLQRFLGRDSGEFRYVRGKRQRDRERISVRGLNDDHNRDLKNLSKGAAISASTRPRPLHDFYVGLLAQQPNNNAIFSFVGN